MDEPVGRSIMSPPNAPASSGERWALRLVLVFTLAGAGVAGYLLTLHAAIAGNPNRGFCTFTETLSCDKVLASAYAEIAGIPLGAIGFVGFVFLFVLASWRLVGGGRGPRWLPVCLVLTAGFGLSFELVMTWIELFVIEAVCPYCLTALGFITATFIASLVAWQAARRIATEEIRHA
jgi:uncharacterized membrane protein